MRCILLSPFLRCYLNCASRYLSLKLNCVYHVWLPHLRIYSLRRLTIHVRLATQHWMWQSDSEIGHSLKWPKYWIPGFIRTAVAVSSWIGFTVVKTPSPPLPSPPSGCGTCHPARRSEPRLVCLNDRATHLGWWLYTNPYRSFPTSILG